MTDDFRFGEKFEEPISSPINSIGQIGTQGQLKYPLDQTTLNILKAATKDFLPELNRVQAITLKSGDITFEVRNSDIMSISATAAVSITTITNGYDGQILTLLFNDANVTLVHSDAGTSNTINLGGANVTGTDNTTLQLIFYDTSWYINTAISLSAVAGSIGGFNIGADYIRDVANSMGLASTVTGGDDVRFWAGDTFANRATAPFRITEAGAAVFRSIQVGGLTTLYTLNDNGYFSFGDGSDGTAVFNGTDAVTGATRSGTDYTLTRDVYYTDATLSTGVTLNPAGYRIFGSGTLTLNGTGLIRRNGVAGGAGTSATTQAKGLAGTAGTALADGYLKG